MDILNTIKSLAEQGSTEAQYKLGVMYANGDGVDKNERAAIEWYQKVVTQGLGYHKKAKKQLEYLEIKNAEQGDAATQYNLGVRYANGQGVIKNESAAIEWYQKAAEKGHVVAQYNLSTIYATAAEWYTKAAEQGNVTAQNNLYKLATEQEFVEAQYNLGVIYANGQGVLKNERTAVQWFQKVADQGNAEAMFTLGVSYELGQGVSKNMQTAYFWFLLADRYGHQSAQEYIDRIQKQCKSGPMNLAQNDAANWRPKQ
jgi:uncharacterized protein